MIRTGWMACLVMAAAARGNEIPKGAAEAFEKATEFDLYSLDPGADGVKGGFHGWKVLGKTSLKGDDVKKVRDAVEKGRKESDGTQAKCFEPRHGIRIVQEKKTYDLVICYTCFSADVFEGETRLGGFLTTRGPAEFLNKVLKDAKVPLAGE